MKFRPNGKVYQYLSRDESVRAGDKAVVETASDLQEVIVTEVMRYTKKTSPYAVDKMNYVVGRK